MPPKQKRKAGQQKASFGGAVGQAEVDAQKAEKDAHEQFVS